MRNNLPREVHVRFTKKTMRTEIMQKATDDLLKYKGKNIIALKQIPRKVRDLRREYQFLTKMLIKKEVNYRWLIPEGSSGENKDTELTQLREQNYSIMNTFIRRSRRWEN
uniref:L1 transposable element RRM domain-containing protein n=2 Tax=Micrurus TaxID=8634 RepID=A0A2D4KHD0_9SAUR